MKARIIDGKSISKEILGEIKEEVNKLKSNLGIIPGFAVVLVGDDPASHIYVRRKKETCRDLGINTFDWILPDSIRQEELINIIKELNTREDINGILVQLPLPRSIDEQTILETILPVKDVDGLHPINLGRLFIDNPLFVPCTPAGILELIDRYGIELKGKEAVVVGRSKIVGKPLAHLLLRRHATVTLCHSRTQDLSSHTKRADVLAAAIGKAKIITADMVKEGAIVIDVGINRIEGKLVGDVDFEAVCEKADAITPVPGGVGPMTIAMLMRNTITACKMQNNLK